MLGYSSELYRSVKITDKVYYYVWEGRGNTCNTCLFPNVLRGERPHVVIDPGCIINDTGVPAFDGLAKAMEKDGFDVAGIGLALSTHYHTDHSDAAHLLIDRYGTIAAMSRQDYDCGQATPEYVYASFNARKPSFLPFFYLQEGTLDLGPQGRLSLDVMSAPGHSPGSMCFYWPEAKALVTGDAVFAGSIGRTDFPGGNAADLRRSIDKLSRLDVEHLLPGHSTAMGSHISGKSAVVRNFQTVKLFLS